mmetsp:Transcript_50809/g.106168  ORF Transcript_50809/g.106168 Transcript_50809/m.106168 type:complete len:106 (-) Transcript_50809:37-354(-)
MVLLISLDIWAVLLYQYPGLCEKRGCPQASPVSPQSCTEKASSLVKLCPNFLNICPTIQIAQKSSLVRKFSSTIQLPIQIFNIRETVTIDHQIIPDRKANTRKVT